MSEVVCSMRICGNIPCVVIGITAEICDKHHEHYGLQSAQFAQSQKAIYNKAGTVFYYIETK